MKKVVGLIFVIAFLGGCDQTEPESTVDEPTVDIWTAAEEGDIDAIRQHVISGTDINETYIWFGNPCSGGTPLHVAVLAGQMEAAKLLLEQGANINAKADDEHGGTPLHWAAATGRKDLATLLIDAGANVNAVDNNGYTPLDATNYKAEQVGARKHEIAEHLKEHGGKTRSGRNSTFVVPALDIWTAAADGNIDAIRLHVMAGTDINETFKGYLT